MNFDAGTDDFEDRMKQLVSKLNSTERDVLVRIVNELDTREFRRLIVNSATEKAGSVHDLKNHLGVIQGYKDLLTLLVEEHVPHDTSAHIYLEQIGRATDQAKIITDQLLMISREESLKPRVLNVNSVLSYMEILLSRHLRTKQGLVVNLGTDVKNIKIDKSQLEQIILNMTDNARDAMQGPGKLTISTVNYEDYVMMSFCDTGIGMDDSTRDKIFDPYFTTKEKGKGTGLGLSTVHTIVDGCRGYIKVYSEPGQGSTFEIYLPHTTEKPISDRLKKIQVSETVLIVDDDKTIRTLLTLVLQKSKYNVLVAESGRQATKICQTYGRYIDLMVTDLTLTDINGVKLAHTFSRTRPKTKVLYISGYPYSTLDKNVASAIDEKHFISKPFDNDELLYKIRELLDA